MRARDVREEQTTMMTIEIDGERTELDLSDCATPEQANARLASLGLLQHVHAATPDELAELEQRRVLETARARESEAAHVERLAYVFLAAGCETQGHPFSREEWNNMQPVDKRAVLAGIRAVLADVRGSVEDE